MNDPFLTPEGWENCLLAHAMGIVPEEAWGTSVMTGNVQLTLLIWSVEFGPARYRSFHAVIGSRQQPLEQLEQRL